MRAERISNTKTNREALDEWRKALEKNCSRGRCRIMLTGDRHGPAYRVTYPDGFWYQVGMDQGVLEVQAKPGTRADFAARQSLMQKDIFDLARKLGLNPHERLGGGHLNFGLADTFGNDAKLFRDFVVDQANHPELNLGILGGHPGNSPTMAELSPEGQHALRRLVEDFDRKPFDIYTFAQRLESEVYISNPLGWKNLDAYQNFRVSAVNRHLPAGQQRAEVRGIRPQKSMEEFLLECELYERRLEFLRSRPGPLPLSIPEIAGWPKAALKDRYFSYLDEMGASREKFSALVDESAFGNSPWPRSCAPAFAAISASPRD